MPQSSSDNLIKRRNAEEIVQKLKSAGYEAYFVGGCVRDFVRGIVPGDYDIVTSALPEQITGLFDHTVAIGAKFGVIAVIKEETTYEVATFRRDDDYEDGRRPIKIHYSSARRRCSEARFYHQRPADGSRNR